MSSLSDSGKDDDLGRLILWPGLGADERMFAMIGNPGVPLEIPRHLVPKAAEDLHAYARRTAAALALTPADVVGGVSFGGVVAAAIARELPVRKLVLISSALDASGLRHIPGEKALRLLPPFLLRPFLRSERAMEYVFAPEGPELRRLAKAMLDEVSDDLLLYGGRMLMEYAPAQPVACPVFAIHGGRDPVMAPPPVAGCRLLPEAGHGLAWTHGPEVTDFLRQMWRECPTAA